MDWFNRYRFAIVTAVIGVLGVIRVAKPDWVLPEDKDIAAAIDAIGVVLAPVITLVLYRKTSTASGTLKEFPNETTK